MDDSFHTQALPNQHHKFIFRSVSLEALSETIIAQNTFNGIYIPAAPVNSLSILQLQINQGVFTKLQQNIYFPIVTINQVAENLIMTCECHTATEKLCLHEAEILVTILSNNDLGIFFKKAFRHQQLKAIAHDYGFEEAENLEELFDISLEQTKLSIRTKNTAILAVTTTSLKNMEERLALNEVAVAAAPLSTNQTKLVVLRQHKFQRYLIVDLVSADFTKEGKIKNPVQTLAPLDFLWQSEDPHLLKFYAAIHKLQQYTDGTRSLDDIRALKAVIKNPAGCKIYYHDAEISEKIVSNALIPVQLYSFSGKIILHVNKVNEFYEISATIENKGIIRRIQEVPLKFNYFLDYKDALYLVEKPALFSLIAFLRQRHIDPMVHSSRFKQFKTQILDKITDNVQINYPYIKPATSSQLREQGFNLACRKIIYLSESSNHIILTPTMSYSDIEIPVRSKRQIYSTDDEDNEFLVERNEKEETSFTSLIMRQHPQFEEQLENDLDHFYLHKERFLNEDWFLNAFEEWSHQGILVLGFNELEGNKLNPNKVKVNIKVLSGINWFNATFKVFFGKKKVPLKSIQKAILNKSKYIQLDDGTLGILPAEWIEKFKAYFDAGELDGAHSLLISKLNYSAIDNLFEAQELDESVFEEMQRYQQKWANFKAATPISQPEGLIATLRPYQLQGLNWLNYLDDLNFGGCLADDMGLGKSIQIIAFILSQRIKATINCNLLIVPATLISNWQNEIRKFAPSINVLTVYGAEREKNSNRFLDFEVIITTYGTLLSDIHHLKDFKFNYIFLDESQYIKNPESQRYKAVRLLNGRNRIVITGTPIENNTFDLYSQLSFACPGLLGSKRYFRDIYATPIDTFKISKRARELQQKIQPFLLRRTKQEVALELPPKTEIILYCEMEAAQRKIYDAYEKEFREYVSAATNEELKKKPMNVLNGLTKLRQICNAPSLVKSDNLTEMNSAKLDMLLKEIDNKSKVHKILVFSQFVSMLDLIKTSLKEKHIPFEYLTGKTKNRAAVIESFQNKEHIRVFLISLKAGGTGLNLTQADYVYLVDPWWNPAVENQAIDRAHRIGQENHVIAVRLICPNTVEDKILKMQQSKKDLTEHLILPDTEANASFKKEDLLALLTK